MKIMLEEKADYREVEELVRNAFWNIYRPGAFEHFIVHNLRNDDCHIQKLTYVIEKDDLIIGSINYSMGKVFFENDVEDAVVLGPVAIDGNCNDTNDARKKAAVRNSIEVTNPSQSYGGKDAPTNEEIRFMTKYISAAQNRCVTLSDYYARLMEMPAKYGLPFRVGVVEENNKVVIYSLGLDADGRLTSLLSERVAENMKEYLSNYRMINDFIEIRSGRIINLAFEVDIYVEKSYDKSEVSKRIIDLVREYMDIRKHQMGEDIFIGDLEKEISKLDGVQNLIELRCYNKVGNGYSDTQISQQLVTNTDSTYPSDEIDLRESDKTLFSEAGSMFEIRYNNDITVGIKSRD